MSKRSPSLRTAAVLGLGAVLWLAAAARPSPEEVLKPAEIESLGKLISDYRKAAEETKGVDKATEKFIDELEKLKKRTKRDLLALPADLGRALWQSFDYEKRASALKKGSIKEMGFLRTKDDKDSELKYALWVPAKYDPKKAYPLILTIPDKGKKPADHILENWTDAGVRDGAVICAITMPAGDDTASWLEFSQGRDKEGGLSNVLATFFEVSKSVAIDFDRVYVSGHGEGVRPAISLAGRFPERFAGAVGRSGDPVDGLAIETFKNLPTFFAGAGQGATAFSEKITAAKYDNCTIKPDGKEADAWAWMQDHPRIANPPQVVLSAPGTVGMRAYWLSTPAFDSAVVVSATIDAGTNTITIDAEGATEVTIFFNDQLLDLEKDVKVVCNGTPHVDKIPRSVTTVLDMIRNYRADPGRIFVAQRKYDVPPKPKPKAKPAGDAK